MFLSGLLPATSLSALILQFATPAARVRPFFEPCVIRSQYLAEVVGVAIFAHLGDLVAIEPKIRVTPIRVFVALSRDGVRFSREPRVNPDRARET